MKESDAEDTKVLDDFGRSRRRSLPGNFRAGRRLLLGTLTAVCILLCCSQLLYSFTSVFSCETSKLLDIHLVGSDSLNRLQEEFVQRVAQNDTDELVIEMPRSEEERVLDDDDDDDDDDEVVVVGEEKTESKRERIKRSPVSDAVAYLEQLSLNLTNTGEHEDNGPYHNRRIFESDYAEMKRRIKVFVYPYDSNDPFVNIYKPIKKKPSGNYASEEFFQQALQSSGFITEDPAEANFFFMPISITKARIDKRIGVEGLKDFCGNYVENLRKQWSHWNRSSGADHFYLSCHSIARGAMDNVPYVRENAIQLLCPSSYYLPHYIPHKDASVPQVWPRPPVDPAVSGNLTPEATEQRKVLAFFAGASNSPVRQELIKHWENDDKIMVHKGRVPYPYSQALMTSRFCLQAKGFEVNTARLGDSMFYGCVPVVIANYYDLPYQDILDWKKFSIVVAHDDIPLLRQILEAVTDEQYLEYHRQVMLARRHFQWHAPPQEYDAFHTVMYELWKRRHILSSRSTSSLEVSQFQSSQEKRDTIL